MLNPILFAFMVLASPQEAVIVLKNGLVIENPKNCQSQDGFLRFTDQDGNLFQIPQAWVAFTGHRSEDLESSRQPEGEAAAQTTKPSRPDWSDIDIKPRDTPLIITDEDLAAYSGANGVSVINATMPPTVAEADSATSVEDAHEVAEKQRKLNAKYRKESRRLRQRIERTKARIRRVEKGLFLTMRVESREKLKERLTELKSDLEQAEFELKQVRREARKNGAKPRNY